MTGPAVGKPSPSTAVWSAWVGAACVACMPWALVVLELLWDGPKGACIEVAEPKGLAFVYAPQVLTTLEDFAAVRDSVLEQGLAVDHDNSGPVYLPLMTIEACCYPEAHTLSLASSCN